MIPAFTVLCLVIDGRSVDLNLTGGEVTLEVSHIIHSIPQTELYIRKYREFFWSITLVCKRQFVDLTTASDRYESGQFCLQLIPGAAERRITHSMMAFVGIQIGLCWHPSRIPDGVILLNIVVMSIAVIRNIVVTITCQTKKLRIFIETVTSACIGNQREKILGSQIVDPWEWSLWGCDDIFFSGIIKISVFHK